MPFGKYKDMAACIADNQDKEKPEAFCAQMHKDITGEWPGQANMQETNWFQVFKAGDYKEKGKYNTADLESMKQYINDKSHIVPVQIGHEQVNPEFADGYLKEARVAGDILEVRADLQPDHVKAWNENKLLTWSISVYDKFKGAGKALRTLALDHIAALGKTPPEIKGLSYKPTFAFDEDETNGEFITLEFSEENRRDDDMELKEALQKIADLEKEKAVTEVKVQEAARFSEDITARDAEIKTLKADKAKAETDLAALKAEREKEKADFAEKEIDRLVEEKHAKEGYPKDTAESWRTIFKAERGLINFAETPTALSDALKKVADAKRVPLKPEGDKHGPGPVINFAENLKSAQDERMKLTHALAKEKSITFSEAQTQVMNLHPELYPDLLG